MGYFLEFNLLFRQVFSILGYLVFNRTVPISTIIPLSWTNNVGYHYVVKSECMRDGRSTVLGPTRILTKLAPEVRLGPKPNLATPFRPILPIWPAQGPPKWPFLDFEKSGFLVKSFFSKSLEKCLLWVFGRFLAPKCPVFRILELSAGSGEL